MEKKLIREIGLETVFDDACKSHLANFILSGYGFCFNKKRGHLQSSSVFCSLDQLKHWPVKLRQVTDKIEIVLTFSCLTLSATLFWYLWAVNYWSVISLVVSQARLSILLPFDYVSQTGPTVTTDVKNRDREDFDHNDPTRAGSKLKKSTPR